MRSLLFFLLLIAGIIRNTSAQIPYPGVDPGQALVKPVQGNQLILENDAIKAGFLMNRGRITFISFEDRQTREQIILNIPLFDLIFSDSSIISSNDFTFAAPPVRSNLMVEPQSVTYVNKIPGYKYSADFTNEQHGLNLHWEVQLRNGSNYIRQVFIFSSVNPVKISNIILIKLPGNLDAKPCGTVQGVPIIHNNMFFAAEHPLSKTEHLNSAVITALQISITVTSSDPFIISSVWGTTPVGQLRRGFLYYMERERAAPYHQMSFYNSWGDIAFHDRKMSERACLERIRWIGDSLITKRNIKLKAFLFDDGWDDNKTLWQFHPGFPYGFTRMKEAVESYGSTLGVWISPFGGYGDAKRQRLEYGKKQNPPFETNDKGFSLAGPVYYQRYKEVVINFVKKYNITMLKFDGVAGNYKEDISAYLKVIKEIREVKPDLYFCLTIGTWPSPYFIKYGDIVWRGGADWGYAGEGTNRQKWITYRDGEVYKNIVQGSPIYPLNALQRMGIFVGDIDIPGDFSMNEKDISDDIWSALATGTSVQGLYINANRMNTFAWDCLADALTWAKENESIMADIHWIGGDPAKGEVYGHAAWSPEKAVLSLRNPSRVPKTFKLNVSEIFELPSAYAKNEYLFYDAKTRRAPGNKQPLAQGGSFLITLQPFEVKVFDALLK